MTSSSINQQKINRLRWACRRGMLELDTMLERYINEEYAKSSKQEQQLFDELLLQNDDQLFRWFMQHQQPSDSAMAKLVAKINHSGDNNV